MPENSDIFVIFSKEEAKILLDVMEAQACKKDFYTWSSVKDSALTMTEKENLFRKLASIYSLSAEHD